MASRTSHPGQPPAGPVSGPGRTARVVAVACLVLALVLAGLWWHARHRDHVTGTATPASSTARPVSRTSSPPAASASPQPTHSRGCSTATAPLVPTQFSVDRLHLRVPVVSVDAASSHGTMAPPTDQPWQVAWISTTARPGAPVGAVNLSAHTYQQGGALGNLLHHDDPLRPGDVLRLSDAAGHRVCYRYTGLTTFRAADYRSDSTLYYDAAASPELRLMVCWDKDDRGVWESRIVFRATPIS